jgi:hypothetical protein
MVQARHYFVRGTPERVESVNGSMILSAAVRAEFN